MPQVSVRRCLQYTQAQAAVNLALQDVGAEKLFSPGDRVLLKVNCLSAKDPEQAVTTHPEVVVALALWFKERGAQVLVGDSSAGFGGEPAASTARALQKTGMAEAAARAGAQLVNLDSHGASAVHGGRVLSPVLIARPVLEADLVVSVAKLKTHGLTLFTGAVKNMYGTVPGGTKPAYHKAAPTLGDFCQGVVDICLAAKPRLSVMDGVVGMEGAGPSAGTPRHVGVVLASEDPVALDTVACRLIGCEPRRVQTNVIGQMRGLGSMEDIQVLGDEAAPIQFELPPSGVAGAVIPGLSRLMNLIGYLPNFSPESCINCNICVASCPVEVLSAAEPHPVLDANKCIQCFCCHELCPEHAITLKPRHPSARRVMDWLMQKRRKKQ